MLTSYPITHTTFSPDSFAKHPCRMRLQILGLVLSNEKKYVESELGRYLLGKVSALQLPSKCCATR